MPPRSATSPLPQRPPSPSLTLSQDCAFPPFLPSKTRSNTVKTSSEMQTYFDKRQTPSQAEPKSRQPLQTLRFQSGEDMMRRMDTIAPGPFDMRQRESDTRASAHKSSATINSNSETINPPSASSMRGNIGRSSTSGPEQRRKNSLSSIPRNLQGSLVRAKSDGSMLSSGSASSRSLPHDQINPTPPAPLPGHNAMTTVSNLPDARSQTAIVYHQNQSKQMASSDSLFEKTVKPSYTPHTRVPSVAAANRPLHEIGSVTSYRPPRPVLSLQPTIPSKSGPSEMTRTASANGDRKDGNTINASQLITSRSADDYKTGNPYHTPTESTSSNEWSGSEVQSNSSRSSPPLSASPYSVRRRPSDTSRIDSLMNDIQATISDTKVKEEQREVRRAPPPSFSRPMYARTAEPLSRLEPVTSAPESPLDPSREHTTLSSASSPLTRAPLIQSFPKSITNATKPYPAQSSRTTTSCGSTAFQASQSPQPQQSPSQQLSSTTPVRRPTAGSKGNCRGCNEPIQGKSVSSADGRLTGRYHKKCFVCKTCKEPFQTADFYVINNNPYCSRHYHQLNGSLCKVCDRGIEGQYLETELKQKFHPHCFGCYVGIPCQSHDADHVQLLTKWETGLS